MNLFDLRLKPVFDWSRMQHIHLMEFNGNKNKYITVLILDGWIGRAQDYQFGSSQVAGLLHMTAKEPLLFVLVISMVELGLQQDLNTLRPYRLTCILIIILVSQRSRYYVYMKKMITKETSWLWYCSWNENNILLVLHKCMRWQYALGSISITPPG